MTVVLLRRILELASKKLSLRGDPERLARRLFGESLPPLTTYMAGCRRVVKVLAAEGLPTFRSLNPAMSESQKAGQSVRRDK